MSHPVVIAGVHVELEWTQETARRFAFRMGEIGGEPTPKQLSNPRTVTTALFKVLWGLLPSSILANYPDPESLFVAVNHETEAEGIFAAIGQIYGERYPSPEKKSTLKSLHSSTSRSASTKINGKSSTQTTRTN